MPVPDYQSLMLPLLRFASDGEEHSLKQAVEDAVRVFKLSDEERQELMRSGVQTKIYNRLTWARSDLGKAGFLIATGSGRFKISPEGLRAIQENPDGINLKILQCYPAYATAALAARAVSPSKTSSPAIGEEAGEQTPLELLESSFQLLQAQLSQNLLEKIGKCSPAFFERLVVDLLVAMVMAVPERTQVKRSANRAMQELTESSRKTGSDWMRSTCKRNAGKAP